MSTLLTKISSNSQVPSHKRHVLTLEERVNILKYLDSHPNEPMNEVCMRFSSNPRTLRRIQDKRETLLNLPAGDKRLSRTRITKGNCLQVEQCVLKWMDLAYFYKQDITNSTLQNRAKFFFSVIQKYIPELPFLAASNGWINRFKLRNALDLKELNSSSLDFFSMELTSVRASLQQTVSSYHYEDVFSLSTTMLYYSFLATASYPNPTGSSYFLPPSERITLLVCTNSSTTETIPPCAVVTPENFSNTKRQYVSKVVGQSGRLCTESFLSWLSYFNSYIKQRHVLLILDYTFFKYFSNSNIYSLYPNINFRFLPQQHANALQSLNLGVIDHFKSLYRSSLLEEIISLRSCPTEMEISNFVINQEQALNMIYKVWSQIPLHVIQLSWKLTSFMPSGFASGLSAENMSFPNPFHLVLNSNPYLYSFILADQHADQVNLDKDGRFPTESEMLFVDEVVSYYFESQPISNDTKSSNQFTVKIESNENQLHLTTGKGPQTLENRGDFSIDSLTCFHDLHSFKGSVLTGSPNCSMQTQLVGLQSYQDTYSNPAHMFGIDHMTPFMVDIGSMSLKPHIPNSVQIQNADMLLKMLREQLNTDFGAPSDVTAALDMVSQYVHQFDLPPS